MSVPTALPCPQHSLLPAGKATALSQETGTKVLVCGSHQDHQLANPQFSSYLISRHHVIQVAIPSFLKYFFY